MICEYRVLTVKYEITWLASQGMARLQVVWNSSFPYAIPQHGNLVEGRSLDEAIDVERSRSRPSFSYNVKIFLKKSCCSTLCIGVPSVLFMMEAYWHGSSKFFHSQSKWRFRRKFWWYTTSDLLKKPKPKSFMMPKLSECNPLRA